MGPSSRCRNQLRDREVHPLAIRDLKPASVSTAASSCLQCAALAHNLMRWTAILGQVRVDEEPVVARRVRSRLFTAPPAIGYRVPPRNGRTQPPLISDGLTFVERTGAHQGRARSETPQSLIGRSTPSQARRSFPRYFSPDIRYGCYHH